MNALARLTSFNQLQIGDKVTRVTINGFQVFVYMGDDPHAKKEEHKNQYGYFLDSFGRTKVERWYSGYLDRDRVYVGYDSRLVKCIEYELLEERLNQLKGKLDISVENCTKEKDVKYPLAFITSAGCLKLKHPSELSPDGTPRYFANPNSDATYCLKDCLNDYVPVWSERFLKEYQKNNR
ncbi:hypothetical protein [Bacteroides sp. 224]|uniref:hypothetical protein n=1 Tax=Bacteroides sp. 224 TaxID=2302936 RepID=UPI0013D6C98C|nr:hypothetical protein [Bacteroides sp. 224]NDV63889.1 hypothetical protein [Bacteroides sp. 224]